MADFGANVTAGVTAYGRKGRVVTPSDGSDLPDVAKTVTVTGIGSGAVLQVLPADNDDGEWITFTGVPVGFSPQYQIRRVGTATTCTVASVLDARAT